MITYFELLKAHLENHPPNFGDGDSVLSMLYECYTESNRLDDSAIKNSFDELYRQMHGQSLREMDKVIYTVCTLCREHERAGFIHGVQVGVRLEEELKKQEQQVLP